MEYIFTFENSQEALLCESELKKRNLKFEIIPSPSIITRSCGLSIKLNLSEEELIKNIKDLKIKAIYEKIGKEYKRKDLLNGV